MSNFKMKQWTKPGTNEVRIYFNNFDQALELIEGIKVYAYQIANDSWAFKISGRADNASGSMIADKLEYCISKLNNGKRVLKFSELLAFCN